MEEPIKEKDHSQKLRYKLWGVMKFLVGSKILPGIFIIFAWLMSCIGYYRYISVYIVPSFENWQQVLEIKPDMVWLLVRIHVVMLMGIVFLSGFAGICSLFIKTDLKGDSKVLFVVSVIMGTFMLLIFAIGVQLYFTDPYSILKSLMDGPKIIP